MVVRAGVLRARARDSARRFCRALCDKPIFPAAPVYGGNNWYYAYGKNCSASDIERDAAMVAELAPAGGNRPYMVIDDGWTPTNTVGPWDRGNQRFPDMAALAAAIRKQGVRPGIWLRPLATTAEIPQSAKLRPRTGARQNIFDPTFRRCWRRCGRTLRASFPGASRW